MSLNKTNAKEGLLGSRKTTAALACVLALAMVVCAFAVTAPSDNGSSAVTIDESYIQTVDDGEYLLDVGNVKYEVATGTTATIVMTGATDPDSSTGVTTGDAPGAIVLNPGSSVTIEATGSTNLDYVNVYAKEYTNGYDGSKYIAINSVASQKFSVTVSYGADGVFSVSSDNIQGTDYTMSISNADVVIADDSGKDNDGTFVSNATITGLGYAFYVKPTSGDYTYYNKVASGTTTLDSDDGVTYSVNDLMTFTYTDASGNKATFTASAVNSTPAEVSVANGAITVSGITLTSGVLVAEYNSEVSGAAVVNTPTGNAAVTFYAADSVRGSIANVKDTVVTVYDVDSITIGTVGEGNNYIVLGATESTAGIEFTFNESDITVGAGSPVITDFNGTIKSTGDTPLDFEYGYAYYASSSWSYYSNDLGTSHGLTITGAAYKLNVKSVDSAATEGVTIGSFKFAAGFASTGGFLIDAAYASNYTYAISGTYAGTLTLVGDAEVAGTEAAPGQLTVDTLNFDVSSKSVTLKVPQYATLNLSEKEIGITAGTGTSAIISIAGGTVNGTVDLTKVSVTVPSANIDSVTYEFDYAVLDSSTYTLSKIPENQTSEFPLTGDADGVTYLVRNAPVDIRLGTTSGANVLLAEGFDSDDFTATVDSDAPSVAVVSGSYSGTVTVANGATITAVTVGIDAAKDGTLNISGTSVNAGTVTVTNGEVNVTGTVSATINVTSGTVNIGTAASGNNAAVDGTLTLNGGTNAGTINVIAGGITFSSAYTNNGTINNNGLMTVSAAVTNNSVINDGVSATYAGENDITNATSGTIAVDAGKANALAVAAVVADGTTINGSGWTYTTGTTNTLTLTGTVSGQYFDGDIDTVIVSGTASINTTTIASTVSVSAAINTSATALTIGSAGGQAGSLSITTTGTTAGINATNGTVTVTSVALTIVATGDGIVGTTVTLENVTGTIGGAVAIEATEETLGTGNDKGIVLNNSSLILTGTDSAITANDLNVTASNLDLRVTADNGTAVTIKDMMLDASSTLIAQGLTFDTGASFSETVTVDKSGLIIVNGGTGITNKSGNLITVYDGLAAAPVAGNIYVYAGEIGDNISTRNVSDAMPADAVVVNNVADAVAAIENDETNIVVIALDNIAIDALDVPEDVVISFAGSVTGDATVAGTMSVGKDVIVPENKTMTVTGTLTVGGTVSGTVKVAVAEGAAASGEVTAKTLSATVNGIAFDGVVCTVLTADSEGVLIVTMTDAEGAAITGTVDVPAETSVVFAQGAVIKGVAVNGVTLNIIAIADVTFTGIAVEEPVTPGEPDVPADGADAPAEEPAAAPAAAKLATYADGDATAATEKVGIEIGGDFALTDNLTIDDLTLNGGTEGLTVSLPADAKDGTEYTLTVNGTLTILGNVEIGEGIVIKVVGKLVVDEDAQLSGYENCITLTSTGTITGNVDSSLVETTQDAVVDSKEEFISALQYYNTIYVQGVIELDSSKDVTYNAYNVDIILNHGKIIIGENVTLVFDEANVEIDDELEIDGYPADASVVSGITVTGTPATSTEDAQMGSIQVNNSDIYVDVEVVEGLGEVLPGEGNTMNVSGTSTGLGRIGFGNTLVIDDAFTLGNRTGDLLVYGTVQVNSGVTLTINQGTTMTVSKSGVLNVDGTVANAGNIVVNGTAKVVGAVTVSETGSIAGAGAVEVTGSLDIDGTVGVQITDKGTVTVNSKKVDGTTVTIYDGATLNIEKAVGTMTVTDEGTVTAYKNDKIAFTPVQDGNTVTLVNAVGYVIETSVEQRGATVTADGKETTTSYQYAVMTVSGTNVEGDVTIAPATGIVIGDLSVAKGSVTVNAMTPDDALAADEQVDEVVVTGTVTVANGATFTNKADLVIEGSVAVTSETEAKAQIVGESLVNATYYDFTVAAAGETPASYTRTYTTFDKAVAVIGDADDDTVYVNNGQSVGTTAENVTGTVVINDGADLTVGADVTLGFAATGGIENMAATENNIIVKGTLYFADYSKYVEAEGQTQVVAQPKISADVAIIDGAARTFTTLANALNMDVTEITLNQNVVLTESMEIPAGITVKGDDKYIAVGTANSEKNVKLTVLGAVQLTGEVAAGYQPIMLVQGDEIAGATGDAPEYYNGVLVLDGDGYVYTEADNADIADVAGAHYVKTIKVPATTTVAAYEYDVNVVSTVKYAADDSENVKVNETGIATIDIVGKTSATDVTFSVPTIEAADGTETPAKLQINVTGDLTVDYMTIVPGVTVDGTDGTITGSVVYTDVGTVDLVKVAGITVMSVAATTGTNATPAMLTISGTNVKGDVTVSAGTVTVEGTLEVQNPADERSSSSLTVDTGATLDVDGAVYTADKVPVTVNGKATVAGTVTVNGKAAVAGTVTVEGEGAANFEGETAIEGTVTVEGAEAATSTEEDDIATLVIKNGNIAGTVDANEYSDVAITAVVTGTVNADGTVVIGTIILGDLGEGSYELGTAVTGELNFGADSKVTVDVIQAYYGTTVTGLGDDVKSTAYVINGKTYMTVYTGGQKTIMSMIDGSDLNLTENGLALDTGLYYGDDEKDTGLYNPANWYKTSNMLPNTILTGSENIGDANAKTVFAQVEPVPVTVTVTVGEGITMYIDGIPYISGIYDLTVGPHDVLLQAQAGFTVEKATVTLYKGTEAITVGDSFTLDAGDENVKIVALGAEQTSGDITIDVPSQDQPVVNVTTGDDEMSLTDYLLIVLVVLIVIMAIIVALRLMRN